MLYKFDCFRNCEKKVEGTDVLRYVILEVPKINSHTPDVEASF
jgi:hypothetical protein